MKYSGSTSGNTGSELGHNHAKHYPKDKKHCIQTDNTVAFSLLRTIAYPCTMRKAAWAISYCLLLIRQSWMLWVLFGVQMLATLGSSQGKEILNALFTDEGNAVPLFFYEVFTLLSGAFYFAAFYWFLFFSNVKGERYDDPIFYSGSSQKIEAWKYQEFLQQYRHYLIRMLSSILLFLPTCIQIRLLLEPGFPIGSVLIILATSLLFNLAVIYFRNNRSSAVVQAVRLLSTSFAQTLESAFLRTESQLKKWLLPAHLQSSSTTFQDQFHIPITTEYRIQSLRQAAPGYRGMFYLMVMSGFLILWLFLFTNNSVLSFLGPLAVLSGSICFLITIILLIQYLNHVFLFPFYLALFCLLLISSALNRDHPIEEADRKRQIPSDQTLPVAKQFDQWIEHRNWFQKDGIHQKTTGRKTLVFLVCAEGGANRSGYWTALMLQNLHDKLGPDFDENLFAISSVSGGSFGAGIYGLCRTHKLDSTQSREKINRFFGTDYLSPLTTRLLCGEPLQLFVPGYVPSFDRAVGFENAITGELETLFPQKESPLFYQTFERRDTNRFCPLLLFHSTECETGKRSILGNVRLKESDFTGARFLNEAFRKDLPLSTAMHLSARFPVFSPSAAVTFPDGNRRHFVDGGYYDRGGYETTLDLLKAIESSQYAGLVQPIVIVLSNSLETGSSVIPISDEAMPSEEKPASLQTGISFLNEPLSVFRTLAAGGENNTEVHKKSLIRYLQSRNKKGIYYMEFDLKASADDVPMNWYLSKKGLARIEGKARHLAGKIPDLQAEKTATTLPKITITKPVAPRKSVEKQSTEKEENISPATHPHLYYFSKKKKMWKLRKDADFNISAIKPLGKKFQKRLMKSRNARKSNGQ
jgi:hypothetical protein